MKYYIFLLFGFAHIAKLDAQTWKAVPSENFDFCSPSGLYTHGEDLYLYGWCYTDPNGPTSNIYLVNGDKIEEVNLVTPPVISKMQIANGETYFAGSFGINKCSSVECDLVVDLPYATDMTIVDNILYYTGTVVSGAMHSKNFGYKDLTTGEEFSYDLGSSGVCLASAKYDGKDVIFVFTSSAGNSFHIFDILSKSFLEMTNEVASVGYYIPRFVTYWQGQPLVSVIEDDISAGYIAHFDGTEWQYSYNMGTPICVYGDGDTLYLSGTLRNSTSDLNAGYTTTLNELHELVDTVGHKVESSQFAPQIHFAKHKGRLYVATETWFSYVDGERSSLLYTFDTITTVVTRPEEAKVYPNPTRDCVTFEVPHRIIDYICLYDMYGNLLLSEYFLGRVFTFDLSHLPSGIYFVSGGGYSGKIVKN